MLSYKSVSRNTRGTVSDKSSFLAGSKHYVNLAAKSSARTFVKMDNGSVLSKSPRRVVRKLGNDLEKIKNVTKRSI